VEIEAPSLEAGDSLELKRRRSPRSTNKPPAIRAGPKRLEQRMAEFNALVARVASDDRFTPNFTASNSAKRVRYLMEAVTAMGFGDASQALTWLRGSRIGSGIGTIWKRSRRNYSACGSAKVHKATPG